MSMLQFLLAATAIRSIAAFYELPQERKAVDTGFDLTGLVVARPLDDGLAILITDGTDMAWLTDLSKGSTISTGDVIRATGYIDYFETRAHCLVCHEVTKIGTAPVPPPVSTTLDELSKITKGCKLVTVEGTVEDATVDDLQPDLTFLTLRSNGKSVVVEVRDFTDSTKLIGARIAVTGTYLHDVAGWRLFMSARIRTFSKSDIRILAPAPDNQFDVEPLGDLVRVSPQQISEMGHRRISGRVIAVWQGTRAIVKTGPSWGQTIRIELLPEVAPPAIGQAVDVIGKPETDLLSIILTSARWKPADSGTGGNEQTSASHKQVIGGDIASRPIKAMYNGRVVRFSGTVLAVPERSGTHARILVESDGEHITVDANVCGVPDEIVPGCKIETTGVCVIEAGLWRPNTIVPRISGLFVIARSHADFKIMSRPSWWSPGRLLAALCVIFATLVGILIWNLVLNRLVERRSRELLRERSAHENADLKLEERMRLAVELHDSLSQNLEGVACQVSATRSVLTLAPEAVEKCLSTAERMLESCRTELRRCLFDLRGNALEARDLGEALHRTLDPLALQTEIRIDCPMRTSDFDDAEVHAVLCIIRELVTNAVRHGKARHVTVSGAYKGGELVLTVEDDGLGFHPEHRPGPDEGHFGLQGIRDRLRRLDGTLSVTSKPGGPTRITANIPISQ